MDRDGWQSPQDIGYSRLESPQLIPAKLKSHRMVNPDGNKCYGFIKSNYLFTG
jgi:hypothetical protein